ncbi:hypothetical protein AK812_SmicGene30171 [Symbiodinium microadriaticum]|uniref:Uncharacterized protein n=1 Tax=Symbiodinium microadriaticum TaxID=2951 RepID=A0A1Q9CZX8_SYMMI|nr:hypothetical protein AK812_SmicGene30171 [Symbiodinium microadriaticum]
MGRETDSPIIGVDIGSFPVIAPDAEQVPLPEFGCQGIDIPGSPQDPSGGSKAQDFPIAAATQRVKASLPPPLHQDVHTELTLSRAVGGAVSVPLKSWPSCVFLKAASQHTIERTFLLNNAIYITLPMVQTRQATPWNDDASFIQILDRVSPQDHRGASTQLPRSWKQSTHEWDTTELYGLSLPKHVVSNRLTREQGIAGMDIFEVPLSKVVSGGTSNWALRQVAHGRTVQWENFRSRQEAILCGVLMRALRSDQAEKEGTDFVTILNSSQKKFFPDSDMHDWTARYNTIKRLAEDLVKEFRKKAPVQANQTLLMRLQILESENARLRGMEDPTGFLDKESEPLAAQATSIRNVNSWLASTALGKGKNRAIDTAGDEFVAACSKLDDGKKKPVDKIAVDWGLSVSLAAKLSEKCLTRLVAGEVQRILRFIVTTERVNFPPLHLPSVKMVEIKILPVSPLANLNLNDTTFLPAKQWQRIAEKEADQQDLPRQISQDLSTLTGATFNVQSVQQAIRATWRSMMNYPATEPVAMVQKALDFSLMLLQDRNYRMGQQCILFQESKATVRATNTAINQLQDREEALEEELKSLKQEPFSHPCGMEVVVAYGRSSMVVAVVPRGEHHPNFPLSFSGCFGQPQQEKTTIEEQGSFDSFLRTPEEISSPLGQDQPKSVTKKRRFPRLLFQLTADRKEMTRGSQKAGTNEDLSAFL